MLNHERLDVYQSALDFAALACGIIEALPETEAFLADELSRSTLAIPVAIAEAVMADEHSDREHHRESALGSTFRSAAAIDILEQRSLVTSEGAARANEAAAKVAERLVALSIEGD
jgi:four helix bundle protein